MKYLTLLIFLLGSIPYTFSQKMPSDYFDEGLDEMENGKIDEAISSFKFIVDNYPNNKLYPRAFYNLAYAYYLNKNYDNAKTIFRTILKSNFNEKENLNGGLMEDPYTNYRHRSATILHTIHYESEQYDSSLYYLIIADTVYPYLHFCGNEYAANEIYMSVQYSKLYRKLNDLESAKKFLLRSIFGDLADNSEVIEELMIVFSNDSNRKNLIIELDASLENMYPKTIKGKEEDYTLYYFRFQGSEIEIPFPYVDMIEFDKQKTIEKIKKTRFYQAIKGL